VALPSPSKIVQSIPNRYFKSGLYGLGFGSGWLRRCSLEAADVKCADSGIASQGPDAAIWVRFVSVVNPLNGKRPLLLVDAEAAFDSKVSVGVRCATRDVRCERVGDFRREERRGGRRHARTDARRLCGCSRCVSRGDGR
jgi:hypothetical protein